MSVDDVPWRVHEAGRVVDLKRVNLCLKLAIPTAIAQVAYFVLGFAVVQTRLNIPQSAESAVLLATLAL